VTVAQTADVVAAAHAETVVAVVAEEETNICENRGSGSGIDSDSGGNVGISGACGDGGWQRGRQPTQSHQ
jgi:hypothetical protein